MSAASGVTMQPDGSQRVRPRARSTCAASIPDAVSADATAPAARPRNTHGSCARTHSDADT
jgi:hypothetical protein